MRLAWPLLPSRTARLTAIATAGVIAVAIGASRIYLGVHWVSDVLSGFAFGGLWLTLGIAAITVRARKHPLRSTTPATRH